MTITARYPVWLPAAPKPSAMSFGVLFAVELMARASVAAVISVQAYDLLLSSQKVSLLFTCVGVMSLIGTLVVPVFITWTARRYVYTLGALTAIVASTLLATFTLEGHALGMILRILGGAALNITTSLYILDNIPRHALVRSEPLRLTLSTVSWTLGPGLGVWLYTTYGPWGPQVFSIGFSIILLAIFWYLRLSENPAIQAAKLPPPNPLKNIRRYASQPRLRLAWFIAFGRSCFWSGFFIYAPLLMITSGLGKDAGGLLVSAGNAVLITGLVWGRLSERIGVRTVIAAAFVCIAVSTIFAGIASTNAPILAAVLLLVATIGAAALDSVGGIPFLRAVRYHERAQMTGVYRTYADLSDLLPPFLYSFVLLVFPLAAVWIIIGVWTAVCAVVAWVYLPRTL